jgi:hypothetical protein
MSLTCYNAAMIVDADSIVSLVANGMSLRDVAKAHDLTVTEVRGIIDEEAARCFAGAELRRQWLLEARRLRELGQKYYGKAMGDGEEAANSAVIFIKASERLATLTGMNAPIGHAVRVIHQAAPPEQKTSTQEILAALDNVLGITARERQLEDKQDYSDEKLTADEQAELTELRSAREAKRARN